MAHLLVVDDEQDIRDLLCETFMSVGHRVTTAENGLLAQEFFSRHSYDAAVVDVEMPEMNGLDLTKFMKEKNPDFPVVLITGYSHLYRPQDVLRLNVEAFLRKPINLNELINVINQITRKPTE
ncbi:MAG: response regulator [Calditrichia bacterium]